CPLLESTLSFRNFLSLSNDDGTTCNPHRLLARRDSFRLSADPIYHRQGCPEPGQREYRRDQRPTYGGSWRGGSHIVSRYGKGLRRGMDRGMAHRWLSRVDGRRRAGGNGWA